MMGPRGGADPGVKMSVNGRLYPRGCLSFSLVRRVGTGGGPGLIASLGQSVHPQGARVRGQLKLGNWVGAHSLPTPPQLVGVSIWRWGAR